jgi:hypothetical protein
MKPHPITAAPIAVALAANHWRQHVRYLEHVHQRRANERVFACRHVAVQKGKRDRVSANERRWISRRLASEGIDATVRKHLLCTSGLCRETSGEATGWHRPRVFSTSDFGTWSSHLGTATMAICVSIAAVASTPTPPANCLAIGADEHATYGVALNC